MNQEKNVGKFANSEQETKTSEIGRENEIRPKNLVFTLHISIFTCSKRIQTGK